MDYFQVFYFWRIPLRWRLGGKRWHHRVRERKDSCCPKTTTVLKNYPLTSHGGVDIETTTWQRALREKVQSPDADREKVWCEKNYMTTVRLWWWQLFYYKWILEWKKQIRVQGITSVQPSPALCILSPIVVAQPVHPPSAMETKRTSSRPTHTQLQCCMRHAQGTLGCGTMESFSSATHSSTVEGTHGSTDTLMSCRQTDRQTQSFMGLCRADPAFGPTLNPKTDQWLQQHWRLCCISIHLFSTDSKKAAPMTLKAKQA